MAGGIEQKQVEVKGNKEGLSFDEAELVKELNKWLRNNTYVSNGQESDKKKIEAQMDRIDKAVDGIFDNTKKSIWKKIKLVDDPLYGGVEGYDIKRVNIILNHINDLKKKNFGEETGKAEVDKIRKDLEDFKGYENSNIPKETYNKLNAMLNEIAAEKEQEAKDTIADNKIKAEKQKIAEKEKEIEDIETSKRQAQAQVSIEKAKMAENLKPKNWLGLGDDLNQSVLKNLIGDINDPKSMEKIFKLSSAEKATLSFDIAMLKVLSEFKGTKGYDGDTFKRMESGERLSTIGQGKINRLQSKAMNKARLYQRSLYLKMFNGTSRIPKLRKQIALAVGDGSNTKGMRGDNATDNYGRTFFSYNKSIDRTSNLPFKEQIKKNKKYILWSPGEKYLSLNITGHGVDTEIENGAGANVEVKIGNHILRGEAYKGTSDIKWNEADLAAINGIDGLIIRGNNISINKEKYRSAPLVSVDAKSKGDEVSFNISHTGIESNISHASEVGKLEGITDGFKSGNAELSANGAENVKMLKKTIEDNFFKNTNKNYKVPVVFSATVDNAKFKTQEAIDNAIKENEILKSKLISDGGFSKEYASHLIRVIERKASDVFGDTIPGTDDDAQKKLAESRLMAPIIELSNTFEGIEVTDIARIKIGEIKKAKNRSMSMVIGV